MSILPFTLLSFVLLSPLSSVDATSDRSICVRNNAPILAEAAGCGDRDSLKRCLQAVPDFVVLDDLRTCFLDLDCTIAEAITEGLMIIRNCDTSGSAPELRRRDPEAMPIATPNPNPQGTSPPQTSATLSRPTECSTGREIKTTACPLTSLGENDFSRLPCTSTTITTMECAATNVCFESGRCIYRDNTIHTGGLVATILLATATVGGAVILLVAYARERRAASRKEQQQQQQQQYDVADPLLQKLPSRQQQHAGENSGAGSQQQYSDRPAASGPGQNPFRGGHAG